MHAVKRAAVYARVSTKKEEQDNAFEASIVRLRAEVERRGFSLVDVYADRLSGSAKSTKKRERYQAMLALAASRGIDVVVVTRLDRLARSLQELMRVCDDFRRWDVDLVVLDQPIDTTTATGRLMFHILGAFAEFERDLTRERIMRGLETARTRGRTLGRPIKESALTSRVHALRAGGASLNTILTTLKNEGHAVTRSWVARRCAGMVP